MTEQTANWIDEETKIMGSGFVGEKLPALKLEQGKITTLTIDFTKPFETYHTTNVKGQEVVKAIIPVVHNKENKVFWLNKRNPLYRELLNEGKKGITTFKITQTGTQADTKYQILKE